MTIAEQYKHILDLLFLLQALKLERKAVYHSLAVQNLYKKVPKSNAKSKA